MSRQSSDGRPGMTTPAFETLEIGRLTWIGLILAGIGWALLIGEATVADVLSTKVVRAVSVTFHEDLLDIARCIIASGFGLAIVGALQTGFGTLNRFFSAVLVRSTQRSPPRQGPAPAEGTMPASRERRPYRTLADGSVEVDTILGTRRFGTMGEARDFI